MPITKDEAGLVTEIGHEVGHAVARHGSERMTESTLLQTGGQILGNTVSTSDPRMQAAANGPEAGYDPRQAVAFWQRFADFNKQQGGHTPTFLRTHPTDATRIQQLQVWPAALAQYHPLP